jgi:restriction endonuclease S subunit
MEGIGRSIAIRDIVGSWPPNYDALPRIDVALEQVENALKSGEILMPARGDNYPARYFSYDNAPVFTVGQVNVITPRENVRSGYLVWYLNQPESQALISRALTGTNIKSLSKSKLIDMPIQLPSLEIQDSIAAVQHLSSECKLLRERLAVIERAQSDGICRKLLNGAI